MRTLKEKERRAAVRKARLNCAKRTGIKFETVARYHQKYLKCMRETNNLRRCSIQFHVRRSGSADLCECGAVQFKAATIDLPDCEPEVLKKAQRGA